jgi:hypothetical protein
MFFSLMKSKLIASLPPSLKIIEFKRSKKNSKNNQNEVLIEKEKSEIVAARNCDLKRRILI